MVPDFEKMKQERLDEVVFNGAAFQYRDHPLPVTAGKRVRIYLVDAGPDLWSSFHVIGAIFDKVYRRRRSGARTERRLDLYRRTGIWRRVRSGDTGAGQLSVC